MLFVKRFFIMMLFLGVYCVFLCCFASGIMSPRDPPGNVELAAKDDEIRMQVVAFMFPGSKVRMWDASTLEPFGTILTVDFEFNPL